MIKTIIFDFGGVVVPISRDKAVKAFEQIGLTDADTRLDKYHQTGIFQDLEEGRLSADEFRSELSTLCGRPLTYDEVRTAWLGFFTGVDERIIDYIAALRERYQVFILSNTNPYVMSWACSPALSTSGRSLRDLAHRLYLSYEIGCTKPAPEIFEYMLRDSGINPAEALFIDDGAGNTARGAEYGLHTFTPENGSDWRADLTTLLQQLA
ncbi:MAG: HAD family phosphatase [Coprobacter sp.]|nr:HAD family phosphatase [Coprobacter sp.]